MSHDLLKRLARNTATVINDCTRRKWLNQQRQDIACFPQEQNPNGGCPQSGCHVEPRRTKAAHQRGSYSSTFSSFQPGNSGKTGPEQNQGSLLGPETLLRSCCGEGQWVLLFFFLPLSWHPHMARPQQALAGLELSLVFLLHRSCLFKAWTPWKNDKLGTCSDGGAIWAAHNLPPAPGQRTLATLPLPPDALKRQSSKDDTGDCRIQSFGVPYVILCSASCPCN